VAEQGDGDYASISEAMRYAQPHTRILVRPRTYAETVVLTKDVEIVGDGPKEQIFLETHAGSFDHGGCLTIKTERALVQGITLRCSGDYTDTIVISQG
jgi:nitrous oxidase accessory protein NosD